MKAIKNVIGGIVSFGGTLDPMGPILEKLKEPIELLNPLFEEWGTILAQLLYPIIIELAVALKDVSPALSDMVVALMPLVLLLAKLGPYLAVAVGVLAGLITKLAEFITALTNLDWSTVMTGLWDGIKLAFNTGLTWLRNTITGFFKSIVVSITDIFTNILNFAADLGAKIWDTITFWD